MYLSAMTPELQTLLLKVRKQTTSSFGVKQWLQVLPELGFKAEVTGKEGRKVTQVTLTSQRNTTLVIDKERGYKHIHFYGLNSWFKAMGVDPVEIASIRLGMDTPEVEAAKKELYRRDLTNTGTCAVCEGNFKREADGSIGHHGYRRPGDGQLHGKCFATGFQPWELSSEGLEAFIPWVERGLAQLQQSLQNLKEGKVETLWDRKYNYTTNRYEDVVVARAENQRRWSELLDSAIAEKVMQISMQEYLLRRCQNRLAAWKLDILPEFKYAGKFKKASL